MSASAANVTPQDAERILIEEQSVLLQGRETDHVNSYYYFGNIGYRTLIGLERVRGDDYSQHYSLMVFENDILLGYYPDIATMPLMLTDSGVLEFPVGFEASEIILVQQNEFPPLCLGTVRCVDWVWQHQP